ncbi:hypothetical protein BCR37DRAFT_383625 [Protomyces lactucae-debilis]|uniref:Uncharacterized protein n=1 Tax=Protomyces lactucae-debilis TaxID=2754530 RepID=A0A1Y2EWY2_PROLT|nr:uncharacterized protein BCR37DRAFT_383625 [Protomyces lactucae-debilis]ORY76070.1 hypothetical protein BCR37DRAFT_383625 [Protomyces lactucae-debilis]
MAPQRMGSMPSWAGGITSAGVSNTLLFFPGAVIDTRANSNTRRKEGLTSFVCRCTMVVQFYQLRVTPTAFSDPASYGCQPSAVYDRLLSGTWLRRRSAEDEAEGIAELQPRRKCLHYDLEHDRVPDQRLCRRSDRQNDCLLIPQLPGHEPFGIGTGIMNVRW